MAKVGHLNMGVAPVVGLLVTQLLLAPEVEVCLGPLAAGRAEVLAVQTTGLRVALGAG